MEGEVKADIPQVNYPKYSELLTLEISRLYSPLEEFFDSGFAIIQNLPLLLESLAPSTTSVPGTWFSRPPPFLPGSLPEQHLTWGSSFARVSFLCPDTPAKLHAPQPPSMPF